MRHQDNVAVQQQQAIDAMACIITTFWHASATCVLHLQHATSAIVAFSPSAWETVFGDPNSRYAHNFLPV